MNLTRDFVDRFKNKKIIIGGFIMNEQDITFIKNKAWMVIWSKSDQPSRYMEYGIKGIFNNKIVAEEVANQLKKEFSQKLSSETYRTIMVRDVTLDGYHTLFEYCGY